jgi:hypothetical protein
LDIFKWFFSVYEIIDRETSLRIDGYSRVAMAYLAHQASTIVDYKRRACADGLDDGGSFSVGDVEHQIKLCFEGYPNYVASTRPPSMDVDLSLVFPEAQRYDVRRLEKPHHHQGRYPS